MKRLHDWSMDYSQAVALQRELAGNVNLAPISGQVRLAAGIDCAFVAGGGKALACAVTVRLPEMTVEEAKWAVAEAEFPYIPGLLSFREAPACIAAAEKLGCEPDVFLVDGQGIAHPRRLGIAAHLGLLLGRPTIGCAKSRLIGEYEEPGQEKGSRTALLDKGERIGTVLRTRTGVKPVFVSPGHMCSMEDVAEVALRLAVKYRLPEPARLAHYYVGRVKKMLAEGREDIAFRGRC